MKKLISILLLLTSFAPSFSQGAQDTTLNNLVLPLGYPTTEPGAIPHFTKSGKGKNAMILIPGWGFDGSVFDDFVKTNKKAFAMYTITIPGFGNTPCPPLPKDGTSFGDQSWNKSVLEGIANLIDAEEIDRPVIVGHFTQGAQLALRLAMDYPNKVASVIILGAPAKFVAVQDGKVLPYPLKSAIYYADKISGPKFYKTVTESYWDQNNYMRELYSLQGETAERLWKQNASVPMPIMIRYLLEFHASDITLEATKIHCPVLVLRPGFRSEWLFDTQNGSFNYIKPQFINSWELMKEKNPLIDIQDITDAGVFLWKDQPDETMRRIKKFIDSDKTRN